MFLLWFLNATLNFALEIIAKSICSSPLQTTSPFAECSSAPCNASEIAPRWIVDGIIFREVPFQPLLPLRPAQVLGFKRTDFVLKVLKSFLVSSRSLIASVNRQMLFLLAPQIEIHCHQTVIPGGGVYAIGHQADQKGEEKYRRCTGRRRNARVTTVEG
jgi:hypothetical protein